MDELGEEKEIISIIKNYQQNTHTFNSQMKQKKQQMEKKQQKQKNYPLRSVDF